MAVQAEVLGEITSKAVVELGRLLPQLSRSAAPLDVESLERIVSHPANMVLVARAADLGIVGMLTLAMSRFLRGREHGSRTWWSTRPLGGRESARG